MPHAIRVVDQVWREANTTEKAFEGESPSSLRTTKMRDRLFVHPVSGRMASFENRAAVFVWDALRLGRRRRSHQLALFYVFALFFQTLNAWIQWLAWNLFLQTPTYAFWGPPIVADLLQGYDWQVQ